MRYDMIVHGGTVVNADGTKRADVAIRDGKIVAVAPGLRTAALRPQHNGSSPPPRFVDATGCYVMPGGVDVHVHLDLPFCGTFSADDYDSGTRAAARGGVTTVIDFATPTAGGSLEQAVETWRAKAEGRACVDYAFHVCLTDWPRHRHELRRMVKQGVPTFKQFMIYEEQGWRARDGEMLSALEACRDLGAMLLVHAESADVLAELIARRHNPADMRKYGARLHAMTRPNFVEAEAIQRAVTWAKVTGGRLYIVHMSTAEGADIVEQARRQGCAHVLAETCPQYLVLDDSVFKRRNGHLFACCPQVKKPADQERLWRGLRTGAVAVVSTDTCTFTSAQKAVWKGDWTRIPMGLPGVETMLPIIFTHGVLKKRLSLTQFVDRCCASPARLMGLGHRKGRVQPGFDADLAIIDPDRRIRVDHRKMETNADWSPYQGMVLAGFPRTTLCRGRVVVDDYRFCGARGYGSFLRRELPEPV